MEQILSSAWDSTTHAENTCKNSAILCVDWVTASFRFADDLQKFFNFIGINQLEELERIDGARYGFAGYYETYKLGNIEIMKHIDPEKYLINMSGQGCREYEALSGYDFELFFALMTNVYAQYTRVDIALDDYKNIFSTKIFRDSVLNGQAVTRLTKYGIRQEGLIHQPGILTMDSFYLGGKNSRYYINVYDKKMERKDKGFEVLSDTWTRLEVRFTSEYADQIVIGILNNERDLGETLASFLNEKITFLKLKVAKETDNKSRSAKDLENHARWWRDLLNTTSKLKLTVYHPEQSLTRSETWLFRQTSITLALLKTYYGTEKFSKVLEKLLVTGWERVEKKHIKRLMNQLEIDRAIASGEVSKEYIQNEALPSAIKLASYKSPEQKLQKVLNEFYQTETYQRKKEKAADLQKEEQQILW